MPLVESQPVGEDGSQATTSELELRLLNKLFDFSN
jgi:hypothetical protein